MDKITGFIEGHIAPVANGLAKNRYIKAIQNTFMTLIPFFTIGSFALIIIEPPVDYTTLEAGPLQAFFQGWAGLAEVLAAPLGAINTFTMGIMGLWAAIGLSYFLSRRAGSSPRAWTSREAS